MGLRPNSGSEIEYEVVENNTGLSDEQFEADGKLAITLKFCKHHEHRLNPDLSIQNRLDIMYPQITWLKGYCFQDILFRLQPHCTDEMLLEMMRHLDTTKPRNVHTVRKNLLI
jgi:hypothetical protein